MAIDDGSFVMPLTIVSAALLDGSPWLAQPPHVGIASGADGPPITAVDVLWDNAVFDAAIPIGSLLEIIAAAAGTITDLSGHVVRRTVNNQSGEFIGVPLFIAKGVFPAQSSVDFAILKTLGANPFYWASVTAELEVVPGR